MAGNDPWVNALRLQASIVEKERSRLAERRRENWKVLQAELTLRSVESAYHRLLTDAPRSAVVRHLRERAEGVQA